MIFGHTSWFYWRVSCVKGFHPKKINSSRYSCRSWQHIMACTQGMCGPINRCPHGCLQHLPEPCHCNPVFQGHQNQHPMKPPNSPQSYHEEVLWKLGQGYHWLTATFDKRQFTNCPNYSTNEGIEAALQQSLMHWEHIHCYVCSSLPTAQSLTVTPSLVDNGLLKTKEITVDLSRRLSSTCTS